MITNRKGEIMLKRAEDIGQFWAYDSTSSKNSDLTLLDNIQFIYELSLAELIGEAFCRFIAGERIESGRDTPIPGAEFYNFIRVQNEVQKEYLHKIHEAILTS